MIKTRTCVFVVDRKALVYPKIKVKASEHPQIKDIGSCPFTNKR
jgi:hypothetical protein